MLGDATKTWSQLEELPVRLKMQQSIQNIQDRENTMKEEMKTLGALAKIKKTTYWNKLQQEIQRL